MEEATGAEDPKRSVRKGGGRQRHETSIQHTDLSVRTAHTHTVSILIRAPTLVMPMTLTMDLRAPRMEPSTSGYSSPRYSYRTTPAGGRGQV